MEFDRLVIYRPAILLCNRTERRVIESVLQRICNIFDKRGRVSIETEVVAKAMADTALLQECEKVIVLDNAALHHRLN